MKKLMLLPLLIISTLVGCSPKQEEEEPIVTIQDWLTNNDPIKNECEYFIGVGFYGDIDYDNYIAKELLRDVRGRPQKSDVESGRALLTYHIKKECGPYTECYILVHENTVEVESFKKYTGEYKADQHLVYDYYSGFASNLLVRAYQRDEEVSKIKKEEYEAASEAGKLENFYKEIEEATTNPIATFSNVTKEDVGHSLLDDIKGLFTKYSETSSGANKGDAFMSYGLNENFMLRFYLDKNDGCIAILEYRYQSSFGFTGSSEVGYKVSRDKVDVLINKITGVAN